MHFGLTEEQQMIVETTRAFVETELYPHEAMVERTGHLPMELIRELQSKAIAAGLYAANMPEEVGGAGLDTLTWLLYEKELGRANYALHWPASRAPRTSCWPGPRNSASATSTPACAARNGTAWR
jgi:butyryl-CoA dehydrogenase